MTLRRTFHMRCGACPIPELVLNVSVVVELSIYKFQYRYLVTLWSKDFLNVFGSFVFNKHAPCANSRYTIIG